MHSTDTSRRTFLRYLASSPLLGATPGAFGQFDYTVSDSLILDPSEAVNVFDFEPVARRNLSLAHYTYLASGVDDGSTIAANRAESNDATGHQNDPRHHGTRLPDVRSNT